MVGGGRLVDERCHHRGADDFGIHGGRAHRSGRHACERRVEWVVQPFARRPPRLARRGDGDKAPGRARRVRNRRHERRQGDALHRRDHASTRAVLHPRHGVFTHQNPTLRGQDPRRPRRRLRRRRRHRRASPRPQIRRLRRRPRRIPQRNPSQRVRFPRRRPRRPRLSRLRPRRRRPRRRRRAPRRRPLRRPPVFSRRRQ